jgi:hypothetical protein
MPSDVDQLARLRVALATGHLVRDLGLWTIEQIEVGMYGRQEVRTRYLLAAADLIGGSRWHRARELERIIGELRSGSTQQDLELAQDTPHGLALRAVRVDPECPGSVRHLLRILD